MTATAFDSSAFLATCSGRPGVYRMFDEQSRLLYVGKASNLKKRLASYFRKTGLAPKTAALVARIAQVETTIVANETEALLLEQTLIKEWRPPYNILLRDDKSYPYVLLSDGDYPRLGIHRGAKSAKGRYFGPYPSAGAIRESLALLQKTFLVRQCEDSYFKNRTRPCLQYQIKRCSAPCVGLVGETDYAADVRRAAEFLSGRQHALTEDMTRDMLAASEALEFETAAELRDQIQALARVQERQFVMSTSSDIDCDVVGIAREGGMVCVNLVMIRGGSQLGDKRFFPDNADDLDDSGVLEAFLLQHYSHQPAPGTVYVSTAVNPVMGEALSAIAERRVSVISHTLGERRVWVEMAGKNAHLSIQQKLASRSTQEMRIAALAEALGYDQVERLECFDISHTMGEATVASCVVYDHGQMRPSEYRHFNISGITPGDDYAAMREALTRRYQKLAAGEGKLPDVLLIDGGKGQVGVAVEVLAELGLNELPIVGVAKGEARKPGLETLVLVREQKTLQLPADHPALHLIQTVRDEAHRFAITGHRARRAKARTTSTLEEIPGVGPKRRQRLLTRFGGLKGLAAASVEDIALVEGINRVLAEKIYAALH